MPKNIVLCCDGTANEFAKHNTNVVKLYSVLQNDSAKQVTYYHPGLGTMEPAGALTTFSRKITKLLGMAFGYGLENDIRDAYVFLMNNYEPGDKVFLFGFSRGSYTVRAVASLLHMYGLVRIGNDSLVPYVIRLMLGIERGKNSSGEVKDYFNLAQDFKGMMARTDCKPWFVGVWDTVSSVGWIANPLKLPYVTNNPDIEIGRHAIAIDERRAFFRNHLWRKPSNESKPYGPKNVRQVWFPGMHCDVGGGYPEQESGLAKGALEWMLEEAVAADLLVDRDKVLEVLGRKAGSRYSQPDSKAKLHESLAGAWLIAEFVPKRHFNWKTGTQEWQMNRFRRRTIPAGAAVHVSAYERGPEYQKRLPPDAVRVERKSPPTFPVVDNTSLEIRNG
jgi:uncharacterized protein (DUF2235 family)